MHTDETLDSRVRNILADVVDLREQKMMGALYFMVCGHVCCGVTGDALIVRVGRAGYDAALVQEHVRPIEMAGRKLSGFVIVDPPGVKTDRTLSQWLASARAFVSTFPAKS